jgi:hypothetical protein
VTQPEVFGVWIVFGVVVGLAVWLLRPVRRPGGRSGRGVGVRHPVPTLPTATACVPVPAPDRLVTLPAAVGATASTEQPTPAAPPETAPARPVPVGRQRTRRTNAGDVNHAARPTVSSRPTVPTSR